MTDEAFNKISDGLREAETMMRAYSEYEPVHELVDRALEGEAGALRILIFSAFNKGYLAGFHEGELREYVEGLRDDAST